MVSGKGRKVLVFEDRLVLIRGKQIYGQIRQVWEEGTKIDHPRGASLVSRTNEHSLPFKRAVEVNLSRKIHKEQLSVTRRYLKRLQR